MAAVWTNLDAERKYTGKNKKTERKEIRPGMVEHMCSHRIWEDEAGISLIPGESDYITRIFDKK